MLPNFPCPEGHNVNSWLRELCRNGWRNKIQDVIPKNEQQPYIDRIKHELNVFEGANLAGYFLIVEDIIRYATKELKCIKSPGRGSGASCLTAYLLDITQIDPIKYKLNFSRFYDESRKNTLPDLDLDFPKYKREKIIDYIKDRYGKDYVTQIATYQTMKGRAALKDVFRAYGNIPIKEQNDITKLLPDPAKIAGELQEMEDKEGESSLIRYTLENDKKGLLKQWCYIDDDGELKGPLAKQFEQAINMEGTKVAQSKHAGGVIISPLPFNEVCPLIYDTKAKNQICSLSLEDAESCGLMKLDCLGIITLNRIEDMIETAINNEAC
jgi:DNA polymerase-3 subunit alpha